MFRLFFMLFFGVNGLYAQLPGGYHASRLALGNAGVAGQELSQLWSNASGVRDTQRVVMASAGQPFSFSGLGLYSAALYWPWKTSAGFLRLASTGTTFYRRTRAGIGGIHHQGNTSWFVSADFLQEEIEGFSIERTLLWSAGVRFEWSTHWSAGAKAESIPLLHKRAVGEQLNVAAGLCWKPTIGLSLLADWQQRQSEHSVIAVGVLYQYSSVLGFRCGWRSDVFSLSAGMVVKWKNLQLDYGIRYQPAPGMTQALSLHCFW